MEQTLPGNGMATDRAVHKKIWLLGQPLRGTISIL
jgi:hypothetical protein